MSLLHKIGWWLKRMLSPDDYYANAKLIFNYFEQAAGSELVAVGILANADQESSLDPAAVGDHDGAFGMWQWHADRCEAIFKGTGLDPRVDKDCLKQCAMAWWELTNPEHAALANFRAAVTTYAAGAAGVSWMRPANVHGDEQTKRGTKAEKWADYFQDAGLWT